MCTRIVIVAVAVVIYATATAWNCKATDLIVSGTTQITSPATYDSVVVNSGGTLIADAEITVTGNMRIASGGLVTHSVRLLSGLVLDVTGTLDVQAGGLIDLNEKGLLGGSGIAPGETYDASDNIVAGAGGAPTWAAGGSYGGIGGNGSQASTSPSYGLLEDPRHLGSGGGGSTSGTGGHGGGRATISATTFVIDGTIRANGGPSTTPNGVPGGGSGGGIRLDVGELSGTGAIQANGGAGFCSWGCAGGGGGGRIAVYYMSNNFPQGNASASGGGGGAPGQPGTILFAGHQIVTTLDDSGLGSLRDAMVLANSMPGRDSITFLTAGTIYLATPLPVVSDPTGGIVIDGVTAPGRVTIAGSAAGMGHGIEVASSFNKISGLEIRDFMANGIAIVSGVSNTIAQCAFRDNGALAIDVGNDGPTLNDAGDSDSGPNTFVNYPTIDTVFLIATDTFYIAGIAPPSSFVQLYLADLYLGADTIGDASGHGEGWLILDTATADPAGHFTCNSVPVRNWSWVSAVATDPDGNTSELSPNRQVIPDSLIFTAYSPVTIIVIEPDSSDSIGPTFNTIGPTASYDSTSDWGIGPNGIPGEPDDRVIITNVQGGTYTIKVKANLGATGEGYFLGIRVDGTNEVYAGVSGSLSPFPVENPLPAEGTEAVFAYQVTATPRGDLDGNRLLDAVDLALLIDIVFFAGTEPNPPALGDINCDSVPDAVDLAILIDHVFFAGDAPCH